MPDVFKIRMVKTGYSYTTTDISKVVFDSDINTLKIRGSETHTLTPSSLTASFSHGLSYTPAVLAWFEVNGNGKWFPTSTEEDQSGKRVTLNVASNSSTIDADWMYDSVPSSLKVFIMLIVDPI